MMDDIQNMFSKIQAERDAKILEHKKHLESEEYKNSLRLLEVVTYDFIEGMRSCSIYCSRNADFRDNSLSLMHIDDYFMSAIMILIMLKEGGMNSAKREMRYLIDSSMRYLYVDQQLWRGSLNEKIIFFDKKIDKSNIKYINEIDLGLIRNQELKKSFCSEYTQNYYKACEYVHASTKQIEERFSLYERGITIGLERSEQLQSVAELLSEVYAALLVFTFHASGVSAAGDLMVDYLSPKNYWVYNGNKYIAEIDRHFDYKHERKAILQELDKMRLEKAWPNRALQQVGR